MPEVKIQTILLDGSQVKDVLKEKVKEFFRDLIFHQEKWLGNETY